MQTGLRRNKKFIIYSLLTLEWLIDDWLKIVMLWADCNWVGISSVELNMDRHVLVIYITPRLYFNSKFHSSLVWSCWTQDWYNLASHVHVTSEIPLIIH